MDELRTLYQSIPIVTRIYITSCVICTLGVQLDILSPFQLYFNYKLIFFQHEYWRLITTFLFFGTLSFSFFLNIMFTYRYSRMLEEGSFRSNSADYFYMLLFGAVLMIMIAPFVKILFLGHAYTIMLLYIWSKRNTQVQIGIFGITTFRAIHLPWIILGLSLAVGNSALTDVMGICVGHIYYYLQDVFPNLPGGFRCLETPRFLVYLFDPSEYYAQRLNTTTDTRNVNNVNTPDSTADPQTMIPQERSSESQINDTSNITTTTEQIDEQNLSTHKEPSLSNRSPSQEETLRNRTKPDPSSNSTSASADQNTTSQQSSSSNDHHHVE